MFVSRFWGRRSISAQRADGQRHSVAALPIRCHLPIATVVPTGSPLELLDILLWAAVGLATGASAVDRDGMM